MQQTKQHTRPSTPDRIAGPITREKVLALRHEHPGLSWCILCPRRATVVDVFFPTHPELFTDVPLTPGKDRAIACGLCQTCYELPDAPARVELVMIEGTRRGQMEH